MDLYSTMCLLHVPMSVTRGIVVLAYTMGQWCVASVKMRPSNLPMHNTPSLQPFVNVVGPSWTSLHSVVELIGTYSSYLKYVEVLNVDHCRTFWGHDSRSFVYNKEGHFAMQVH